MDENDERASTLFGHMQADAVGLSIIRCVTSGIAESTQDVGSGGGSWPTPLGSAAAALRGSAKAAPTASAPPARSMSRRENVATCIVQLP